MSTPRNARGGGGQRTRERAGTPKARPGRPGPAGERLEDAGSAAAATADPARRPAGWGERGSPASGPAGKAANAGGKGAEPDRSAAGPAGATARPSDRLAGTGAAAAAPGTGLVVGPVPWSVRVAGGVATAGAVLRLIAPAFPLARSSGKDLGAAGNVLDFVPPLPLVAVVLAAAALCLRGRLPRLGLATLLSAGSLSAGLLLRTVSMLDTGTRSTADLPLGIATSARYQVGSGLVLLVLAYGLLAAAALVAVVVWPRTVMEDEGGFDAARPRAAAWGLAAGVFAALVLGMSPYTSATALTPPTLPERSGLDLLGGLVLALGAAAWAVLAATLRPRLAVVGAYAGLSAVLATEGLAALLVVARSPALDASAGGIGTLLAALAMLALAGSALRVRRPAADAAGLSAGDG